MSPEMRNAYRLVFEAAPAGAMVALPRDYALELLGAAPAEESAHSDTLPPPDLTAAEFATRRGRSPSTIRGLCERGAIPGSYRDSSRRWRIPAAAVLDFEAAERAGKSTQAPARRNDTVDLGAWRSAS